MKKGKLIVIDGTDGAGKTTQKNLLVEHLEKDGFKVKTMHFPEYANFFGGFIGKCLSEKEYNFIKTHPKIVSVLYAADRWESSSLIKKWLKDGYVVVLDRYVTANQIHQGGKIKNTTKRAEFIKWLDEMEYEIFGIPKPDHVIYLSLSLNFIEELMKKRNESDTREYLRNKKDVHETDLDFQKNSRKSALWLSKFLPNFIKINCIKKKKLLSIDVIHNMVYQSVKEVLI